MAYLPIEETEFYKAYEAIADWAWAISSKWDDRRRRAVGDQVVRALGTFNANLSEGDGRGNDVDAIRFFNIARSSVREARVWLRRTEKWCGVDSETVRTQLHNLTEATRALNALIRYRRSQRGMVVREEMARYSPNQEDQVFTEDV